MTTDNEKNFKDVLAALTTAFACEPLAPEEDGRVVFTIDGNLGAALFPVDAEQADVDGVMAVLVIGAAPPDNAEFLYDLLAGNYMGTEAGDGALAIDRESGALVLERFFELPTDAANFVDLFARLVGAARGWRDRLTVVAGDAAADAAEEALGLSSASFLRV